MFWIFLAVTVVSALVCLLVWALVVDARNRAERANLHWYVRGVAARRSGAQVDIEFGPFDSKRAAERMRIGYEDRYDAVLTVTSQPIVPGRLGQ